MGIVDHGYEVRTQLCQECLHIGGECQMCDGSGVVDEVVKCADGDTSGRCRYCGKKCGTTVCWECDRDISSESGGDL